MSKFRPAGVIPAMVSCATDDGSDIDVVRTRTLTRHLIDNGVHGLFICSSTGDAPLLDRTQRQRLIAAVAEENNGKLPFLVGVGAPATRQALQFVCDAEAGGADCVVALPMHFCRVTEPELEMYFATIAGSTSIPTLLYNYPALTSGQNISPALASKLAANHNIVGIKDSSGDLGQAFQYIEQCGPDFAVFTGFETLLLPLVGQGGAGTICAVANVFPQILVQIFEHARNGSADLALHLQRKLVIASPLWSLGTMPAPIKAACAALGTPVGPPFAPVQALSAAESARVSTLVRELSG